MKSIEYDVVGAESSQGLNVKGSTEVAPDLPPLRDDGADSSIPPTKDNIPHQSGRPKTLVFTRKDLATPRSKASARSIKRPSSPHERALKKRVRVSATGDKPVKPALPTHPSIQDINIPLSQVARLPNGEPDPDNLPWAGVNYKNSMVIYWHDEKKNTNPVVVELFAEKFEKTMTPEAVRRRHVRAIQYLANKYGLKPGVQIGPNDTLHKSEASNDDTYTDITTTQISASTDNIQAAKKRQTQSRDIEKQHIVDLRLSNMNWPDIRDKLEQKYNWSLGIPTIKKYFDEKRAGLARARKAVANQEKEAALSNAEVRNKVGADAEAEAEARTALQARVDALFARPTSFTVRRRSI